MPLADGPQIAVGEYARREPAIGVLDSTTRASAAWRAATRPATSTRAPSPASKGTIRLADAPHVAQRDPDVRFQRIVFDGLVGDAFLRNLVVTYDLAASRLLVA